jgi:hypothetical protein
MIFSLPVKFTSTPFGVSCFEFCSKLMVVLVQFCSAKKWIEQSQEIAKAK